MTNQTVLVTKLLHKKTGRACFIAFSGSTGELLDVTTCSALMRDQPTVHVSIRKKAEIDVIWVNSINTNLFTVNLYCRDKKFHSGVVFDEDNVED